MPCFGCAILLFLTLPGQGAPALTADADCQDAYDNNTEAMISDKVCEADSDDCPASCNEKFSEIQTACAGKNVNFVDSDLGTMMVKTFASHKMKLLEMFYERADEPCKKMLFDKGLTMATDCRSAYEFAFQQMYRSKLCFSGSSSCHTKCQEAINKVSSTCKNGDAFKAGSTKFGEGTVCAMKNRGPTNCDYQCAAVASTTTVASTTPASVGSTSLAITERPLVFTLFLTMLAGLS